MDMNVDLGDLSLLERLRLCQFELVQRINSISDEEEKKNHIVKYFNDIICSNTEVYCPDFLPDLDWLNVEQPLSLLKNLNKKIVVLDFFTYCCINCMHILPDLHNLELRFPENRELIIVGVHSAKFENEKVLSNLMSAVLRYNISHPVVNDPQGWLWKELHVICWPTLVILGPQSQVLFTLVGENEREYLQLFCETAVEYFRMRGSIISSPVPVKLLRESLPVSPLLFPGKVCVDGVGKRIVIADSGHHRILILNREGVVEHVIGGKDPGYKDGNFHQARFRSPQGIVWKNPAIIYVADTENHLIREINVSLRVVTTIAGTGYQGTDKVGGKQNKEQPISSPWDLCLGRSIGSEIEDILFIAMAGIHQVWMLFLEDAKWLKGSCYQRGTCIRFAGNGEEENRNNSYPERAGFAQPSGITIAQQENLQCLFIADSESSTVRQIMLKDGAVKAVVGGEKDPKNLFSFGDEDGKGIEAKLQHPLGVSWCSFKQVLYVADSYNHKVKVITPSAKTCTTLVGTGKAGYNSKSRFNEAELNEPGGLCVTDKGETLLVADTNNHVIKAINLVDETVSEHPVLVVFDETDSFKHLKLKDNFTCTSSCLGDTAYIIHIPTVEMRQGGVMILMLDVNLAPGVSINDEAPNKWQLNISDSSKLTALQMNADINTPIQLSVPAESRTTYPVKVDVEVHLFLCKKELGVCYMKTILFKVVVVICKTGQLEASLNLKCFIE